METPVSTAPGFPVNDELAAALAAWQGQIAPCLPSVSADGFLGDDRDAVWRSSPPPPVVKPPQPEPLQPVSPQPELNPEELRLATDRFDKVISALAASVVIGKSLNANFPTAVLAESRRRFISRANDPTDPMETLLLDQMWLAEMHVRRLHIDLAAVASPAAQQVYLTALVKLRAELRLLTKELREHRAAQAKGTPATVACIRTRHEERLEVLGRPVPLFDAGTAVRDTVVHDAVVHDTVAPGAQLVSKETREKPSHEYTASLHAPGIAQPKTGRCRTSQSTPPSRPDAAGATEAAAGGPGEPTVAACDRAANESGKAAGAA